MHNEGTYGLDLDALLHESLSCRLGCITSETTDLELLGEGIILLNSANDRTALLSCRTENCDKFRHC